MTKVAFFGTSDRSLSLLESLKNNFELVLCVTKAQVLVGRHQIAQEPAVKRWANTNGVNLVTINKSLIREIDTIIEQIKSSKAEVGVVADFSFMLPPQIINIFPRGLINVHFSLLPKYRGASP
ncbi:methionyl-tRNA formyltransferase, partial [Patescibacteria group bacterium]|nr:methionyl-tRNA formyltransferase [Patescibacteria group bacterium]